MHLFSTTSFRRRIRRFFAVSAISGFFALSVSCSSNINEDEDLHEIFIVTNTAVQTKDSLSKLLLHPSVKTFYNLDFQISLVDHQSGRTIYPSGTQALVNSGSLFLPVNENAVIDARLKALMKDWLEGIEANAKEQISVSTKEIRDILVLSSIIKSNDSPEGYIILNTSPSDEVINNFFRPIDAVLYAKEIHDRHPLQLSGWTIHRIDTISESVVTNKYEWFSTFWEAYFKLSGANYSSSSGDA